MIIVEKKKTEFSKTLLKQESALIWIMSLSFIVLAFYCIHEGFTGSLPWLAAMVGFPWTAYGVSQAMYYRKSMAENTTGGVKYDSIMLEAQKIASQYEDASNLSQSFFNDCVFNQPEPTSAQVDPENVDEYTI